MSTSEPASPAGSVDSHPDQVVFEPLDPGASGSPPTAPPAAGLGTFLVLVLAIGVGLLLRVGFARAGLPEVADWEADGFISVWEGRPWGALNRVRPVGSALVLSDLGRVLPVASVEAVRMLSIGLSLLGLLAAMACAASLGAVTGLSRRSSLRAASWIACLWAVEPTLIRSSVSPTPELMTGVTACLLVASLGLVRRSPGLLSWLGACACASAFVLSGGLMSAVALAVGVVVYLMPVPRFRRALVILAGLAVALGTGWFVQRGPDAERSWQPDVAWAYSAASLLESERVHPNNVPTDADRRSEQLLDAVRTSFSVQPPLTVARLWLGRLAFDLLGPRRLEPLAVAAGLPKHVEERPDSVNVLYILGLFELFLVGGLLLFAMTVVGLVGPGEAPACWPRAAVVVSVVVWMLLLAFGAVGTGALSPFLLLLLGVAGAGVAGTDPRRAWTRRLAFAVGGVLLSTFMFSSGWRDEPTHPWLEGIGSTAGEGGAVVSLLADGGPVSGTDQFRAANLLSIWSAPFQRMPGVSHRYAEQAAMALAPTEMADQAVELLVRTYVERRDFAEAARLAEEYHTSLGHQDKRSMFLLGWVQEEQRKTENLPLRHP
jgi:hypothetical protein